MSVEHGHNRDTSWDMSTVTMTMRDDVSTVTSVQTDENEDQHQQENFKLANHSKTPVRANNSRLFSGSDKVKLVLSESNNDHNNVNK